jgi:hypothetical protein
MIRRTRAAFLAALSALTLGALVAPAANANVLSLLPGMCAGQSESQPFAQFGDQNNYTLVPGGNFEGSASPWSLSGGARIVTGNESYNVGGAADAASLALPAGSSATSPFLCTDIYHPTARLFARNTGSSSSRLNVYVTYPTLVGLMATAKVGSISATSSWAPTPVDSLGLNNLLATLNLLGKTEVSFRFVPADNTGNWSIDDVYLDPYARA